MNFLLYIIYLTKNVLSLHDPPTKTLIGYFCPDSFGTPIDMQQGHCPKPREILESSSDQQTALIYQRSESRIRGNICKVYIKKIRYICRLCAGQKPCKKEESNINIPFEISPKECKLLVLTGVFNYNFDLFGMTYSYSFFNIRDNEKRNKLLLGFINADGICQGINVKWNDATYPGAMVELVFNFKIVSIVLDWFPPLGLLTYNKVKLNYDQDGSAVTEEGTLVFDNKDIDCTSSYTQRIFAKMSRLTIRGKDFKLLHLNETNVFEIHEMGTEFNACLNQTLTILTGSMFLCYDCNLMLEQILPDDETRISTHSIRLNTIDGLNFEVVRLGLDEIDYNLCQIRNYISSKDPSFIFDEQNSKHPFKIVSRHGQNYRIKCKKVEILPARTLEKCFEFLPVNYNNGSYFLNPVTNILETQSHEVDCNNVSQSFYKVKTNLKSPTYFCNPPSLNECKVTSEVVKENYRNKYQFRVGQLFQQRHYKARLNKILLLAKPQQQIVFQDSLEDAQIIRPSMKTFPETVKAEFRDFMDLLGINHLRIFIRNLPTLSKINSIVVTAVITVEWISHCLFSKSLCVTNLIILVIFVLFPYLYLFHLTIMRTEERSCFLRKCPGVTTQSTGETRRGNSHSVASDGSGADFMLSPTRE